MTTTDPLHLEMILQRERFAVGSPGMREDVAQQLARDGITIEGLHQILAYYEDRGKRLDDWRAVAWAELRKVGKASQVLRDLRASQGRAGKAERTVTLDHDMAGGERCQHGTPRGHHCDRCDPQMPLGDRMERMRDVMFEDLVRWMMRDIPSLQRRPDDVPLDSDSDEVRATKIKRAEAKRERARKVEAVLRRYLIAVGGDGKRMPPESEITREDREIIRNAVPTHVLSRRIAPHQRFPGEPVETLKGGRMRFENWRREANRHSAELWKTGPLLGRVEAAQQEGAAMDAATAATADSADEWRDITEGVF